MSELPSSADVVVIGGGIIGCSPRSPCTSRQARRSARAQATHLRDHLAFCGSRWLPAAQLVAVETRKVQRRSVSTSRSGNWTASRVFEDRRLERCIESRAHGSDPAGRRDGAVVRHRVARGFAGRDSPALAPPADGRPDRGAVHSWRCSLQSSGCHGRALST